MTKKTLKKRPLKKAPKPAAKTPLWRITPEQQIVGATFLGKVRDYYSQLGVASLILEAPLAVGDIIRIKGHTTDLTQKVEHLEVDHQSVQNGSLGDPVGLKLADKARIGDAVFKI